MTNEQPARLGLPVWACPPGSARLGESEGGSPNLKIIKSSDHKILQSSSVSPILFPCNPWLTGFLLLPR